MNRFTAFVILVRTAAGQVCPGKGKLRTIRFAQQCISCGKKIAQGAFAAMRERGRLRRKIRKIAAIGTDWRECKRQKVA
ncbi:hypothetical protein [Paracoccus luteus]|uniref:hypothetical protein n=1 Tax=Paracoccus luteus TaxID=2508543 RepID=UPI00106FD49D|nr:hypothetical protein [Paracoccus luteus]